MSVASERVTDGRCVLKEVVNIPKATGDSSARGVAPCATRVSRVLVSRDGTERGWTVIKRQRSHSINTINEQRKMINVHPTVSHKLLPVEPNR